MVLWLNKVVIFGEVMKRRNIHNTLLFSIGEVTGDSRYPISN